MVISNGQLKIMNTFKYTTSSKTVLADLYTPVGVYMRLRDLYPQSALM